MSHLLKIAELLAGPAATHRVFEPLLADWHREIQHSASPAARTIAIMSGGLAFVRALAVCAVIDGAWLPPLRATCSSLAAIALAMGISIGVLLLAPVPQQVPRDLTEPLMQRWILVWSTVLLPPAFMLGTFFLRRDTRSTYRHAIIATLLAAAAMTLVIVNTTDEALRKRYDTFEVGERMRELALARERAGARVYTGNRYQEELATTVAERRARFERYRALMAAHRQEPPPTWGDRFAQASPVLFTVIFAVMGWTLAGLRRPTMRRAFGWWALVFAATITMTRIFWLVVQVPMPSTPQWLMPALFTSVAGALAINANRSRRLTP